MHNRAYFLDIFGKGNNNCFLDYYADSKTERIAGFIIAYYLSLYILIFLSTYLVFRAKRELVEIQEIDTSEIKIYLKKLWFYPIIQFAITTPTCVNRIFHIYSYEFNMGLEVIQCLMDCSRGILFVLFFGITPAILKSILTKNKESIQPDVQELNNNASKFDSSFISSYGDDFEFGKRY